jgi:hypothetical protein
MIICRCIKWSDIKSHKSRSVPFWSQHVMIILDTLFIYQLKLNSLYSILHINESKSTRNGRWAPWSSVIWLFEISKCDGGNVVIPFPDTMTLYMHSGNDKSHLASNYERYSCPSAATWSVGHYMKWFCARIGFLIYNSWFRMKSVDYLQTLPGLGSSFPSCPLRNSITCHNNHRLFARIFNNLLQNKNKWFHSRRMGRPSTENSIRANREDTEQLLPTLKQEKPLSHKDEKQLHFFFIQKSHLHSPWNILSPKI